MQKGPKLIIVEYYESLVRTIDLITENLLDHIANTCDSNQPDFGLLSETLNKKRQRMLAIVEKLQYGSLNNYIENREKIDQEIKLLPAKNELTDRINQLLDLQTFCVRIGVDYSNGPISDKAHTILLNMNVFLSSQHFGYLE